MVTTNDGPDISQRLSLFDSTRDMAPLDLEEEVRKNVLLSSVDGMLNWGARVLALAGDVRAGLLRDRDDRVGDLAL